MIDVKIHALSSITLFLHPTKVGLPSDWTLCSALTLEVILIN